MHHSRSAIITLFFILSFGFQTSAQKDSSLRDLHLYGAFGLSKSWLYLNKNYQSKDNSFDPQAALDTMQQHEIAGNSFRIGFYCSVKEVKQSRFEIGAHLQSFQRITKGRFNDRVLISEGDSSYISVIPVERKSRFTDLYAGVSIGPLWTIVKKVNRSIQLRTGFQLDGYMLSSEFMRIEYEGNRSRDGEFFRNDEFRNFALGHYLNLCFSKGIRKDRTISVGFHSYCQLTSSVKDEVFFRQRWLSGAISVGYSI